MSEFPPFDGVRPDPFGFLTVEDLVSGLTGWVNGLPPDQRAAATAFLSSWSNTEGSRILAALRLELGGEPGTRSQESGVPWTTDLVNAAHLSFSTDNWDVTVSVPEHLLSPEAPRSLDGWVPCPGPHACPMPPGGLTDGSQCCAGDDELARDAAVSSSRNEVVLDLDQMTFRCSSVSAAERFSQLLDSWGIRQGEALSSEECLLSTGADIVAHWGLGSELSELNSHKPATSRSTSDLDDEG